MIRRSSSIRADHAQPDPPCTTMRVPLAPGGPLPGVFFSDPSRLAPTRDGVAAHAAVGVQFCPPLIAGDGRLGPLEGVRRLARRVQKQIRAQRCLHSCVPLLKAGPSSPLGVTHSHRRPRSPRLALLLFHPQSARPTDRACVACVCGGEREPVVVLPQVLRGPAAIGCWRLMPPRRWSWRDIWPGSDPSPRHLIRNDSKHTQPLLVRRAWGDTTGHSRHFCPVRGQSSGSILHRVTDDLPR